MLNDIMIFFARKLKDYCDNNEHCVKCPFFNVTKHDQCILSIPQYWDFSGTLDFPNSNKQTEDGSDPFDE